MAPLGQGEVWVLPGHRIQNAPSSTAPTLFEFEAIANVTMLEKRGDWYRVYRRGLEGWVYLEGYRESPDPPYGRAVEPPGPLPPRAPEPEGGTFSGPVLLQMHCATQGASIAWTLEEGDAARWRLYVDPIRLEAGTTRVRAKAVRIGYDESPEVCAAFTVTGAP